MKRLIDRVFARSLAGLFFISMSLGVAADPSTTIDPARQAAWEAAQAQAAKRVADFDAAVKAGRPERLRKAALDLQSDPMAVQKINQTRPDLVAAHNEQTQQIKSGAKGNIKENMAEEWNRLHPNDPPITKKDVEVYEPTNYKDPSSKPKSGQDWDVTVRVKPKGASDFVDVPPVQSQRVVEKSYYDAAGGEKTFGSRAPGQTVEQAAAAASHRQSVETTHGKSAEAYTDPETILGKEGVKPKVGERLSDPGQLTQATEYKSNLSRNKAEAAADPVEAVRQEAEQMRQAAKQFDKITKPRVEAVGGEVNAKVEKAMNILRDAGNGNISPEEARAELAKIKETPDSIIKKAAGQAEAAQKIIPNTPEAPKTATSEPAGGKVDAEAPKTGGANEPASLKSKVLKGAGAALIGVDIASTAEDVKDDLKKGDVKGAATRLGEAGANMVTAGEYGAIKSGLEKHADKNEAISQTDKANLQNEAAYDLQAEKRLRQAGVSRDEVTKIMEAKANGDGSALENKFKELGVAAPEKVVEKAPDGDDSVKERAVAVGAGLLENTQKAGKFVKETVRDTAVISTGLAESGVISELAKQTKENISDWSGMKQDNANAEKTAADFKQGVKDSLIAKGATPEGAEKAADALINNSDPSKLEKLNNLLDAKNKKLQAQNPDRLDPKLLGDSAGFQVASLTSLEAIKESDSAEARAARERRERPKAEPAPPSQEVPPDEQKMRELIEARLRTANLPVNDLLLNKLLGPLRDGGEKALDAAIKEFQGMQGSFSGSVKMSDASTGTLRLTVQGGRVSGTFSQNFSNAIGTTQISRKFNAAATGRVDYSSGAIEITAKGTISATVTVAATKDSPATAPVTRTLDGSWTFRGSFSGSGYKGATEMPWSVAR